MNCDNCKHYCWYYDKCNKWDCEVDAREVRNCFEPYDTSILDVMTTGKGTYHLAKALVRGCK